MGFVDMYNDAEVSTVAYEDFRELEPVVSSHVVFIELLISTSLKAPNCVSCPKTLPRIHIAR